MNKIKSTFTRYKKAVVIGFVGLGVTSGLAFTDQYFEISKNIDLFTSVYKEIHTLYVDEVEPGKLMRTGIDAMLESLDPYTNYISESESEDYRFQITGQYGGIGAIISMKGQEVIINEPYEGFPAANADLRPGDVLLEADGKSLKGFKTDEVSKLLKGSPNTNVKLKIRRHGEVIEKELTRKEIQVKNVPFYEMVNENTGYIRLQSFTNGAGNEVKEALINLKKNPNLKQVILDLRGNPGGLLHEAINVVNVFVDKNQLITSTKGKITENNREYKTLNNAVDNEIPLVVLTSRGSASASEIVSGSIQDLDRGLVLGQRTFGKGLVQSTKPLKYGAQIKITTQKYYIPSGRCIQALDYSNKNEDGSPGTMPDSLRKAFKTKNGRTVYDGGGVEPDLATKPEPLSKISISLLQKQLIFDYAVEFRKLNPSIDNPRNFSLGENNWNNFVAFIKDKDYAYKTDTEKELDQLEEKAKSEGYYEALAEQFSKLRKELEHDKQADVVKNKQEITELLEEEIVRHYYFQKGRFLMSFKKDEDIKTAVELLNEKPKYQQLLYGRK